MTNDELFSKIQETLAILDADELPEVHDYLFALIDEDSRIEESPFEIANQLLRCDKPEPLPEVVRDFIIELFEDAYDEGNADAMNDLGAQYYNGSRGFEQSFEKAVEYYKTAAENGSRQAQENLGYCYYYGRNMPVDYEKAFHYFALGAFDGHIISLYKIGDMYMNGYYVKKNPVEAFHIYMRCLDTMTEEAAPICAGPVFLRAGTAFLNGYGTDEDPMNALICFQKAEKYLYDMVADGQVMYKKSLQRAIEGQAKARAILAESLPPDEWMVEE
ncbi:MAG: sel1 repeat family protein [Clostridiales bacterium]|nr:sel1 repeat family protein [Clostridiales bacterium]